MTWLELRESANRGDIFLKGANIIGVLCKENRHTLDKTHRWIAFSDGSSTDTLDGYTHPSILNRETGITIIPNPVEKENRES